MTVPHLHEVENDIAIESDLCRCWSPDGAASWKLVGVIISSAERKVIGRRSGTVKTLRLQQCPTHAAHCFQESDRYDDAEVGSRVKQYDCSMDVVACRMWGRAIQLVIVVSTPAGSNQPLGPWRSVTFTQDLCPYLNDSSNANMYPLGLVGQCLRESDTTLCVDWLCVRKRAAYQEVSRARHEN